MFTFLAHSFPKTTTASQNPLALENGACSVEFFPTDDPNATYGMRSRIKPGPTLHKPPYHWHAHQTETFHVHSGTMRARIQDLDRIIPAGQTVTIAAGLYHTFYNHSREEELDVSVGLDLAERERDERFFRNLYSYLDDCQRSSVKPQIAQLCLFLWGFDCFLALPGPRWVMKPVACVMVWVLGVVVGKWGMGLKESYEEYYKKASE